MTAQAHKWQTSRGNNEIKEEEKKKKVIDALNGEINATLGPIHHHRGALRYEKCQKKKCYWPT